MSENLFYLVVLACVLALAGCMKEADRSSAPQKIKVVATLFPLYDFARQVGGDRVEVTLLLPPGVEPHSFEPKPGDIARVNAAGMFLYTGDVMEPWAEDIIKSLNREKVTVVDASAGISFAEGTGQGRHGHGHGAGKPGHPPADGQPAGRLDPHIWLDLGNARKMVETIRDALSAKDPVGKDDYAANAQAYIMKLADLDRRFRDGLRDCRTRTFVHGGHFAFGYLARRYGLTYVAAYKGSPDAQPSAKRIAELRKLMQAQAITSVYYEELIVPRVAEVLARETGATMIKLHGAHNVTREEMDRGVTFVDIMEKDLDALRTGLQCR